MRIDHNVAAALLLGMTSGRLRQPFITNENRQHRDRAPAASGLSAERIAAAEARRQRRAAKRVPRVLDHV